MNKRFSVKSVKIHTNEKKEVRSAPPERVWPKFEKECNLTSKQLSDFKCYEKLLSEWSKTRNLTAIRELAAVVNQHFKDSLPLADFVDMDSIKTIADVGAGAGFPGIPLKIMYPHLDLLLIEVNKKKQEFLREVIKELELENVEVVDVDWRTFIRKTESPIDLFITKAALDEVELSRMFKPTSSYRDRQLVYWASEDWVCKPAAEKFIRRVENYKLGRKDRKLVFLGME